MSRFYKLSVKEIQQETENAVSILFEIPENLQQKFSFIPGQYITIKKELNGEEIRRAYSICSSKKSNTIRIGVKAVDKGTFSIYATTDLKEGDVLEVSPPEGRFLLNPDNDDQNYLAFVAGSGITPVLSMIKSVLEADTNSKFVLVYGNKSPNESMFKSEIDQLKASYPERLFVYYIFSVIYNENTLFGRIDASTVNYIIKNKHKGTDFDEFFLCGPENMIDTVKKDLLDKGIASENIHFELFSTKVEEMDDSDVSEGKLDGETIITIVLDDEEETFSMKKEKSILEVALKKGLDAPYSCQGGICSSCLAQVTEGKVVMDNNSILSDEEVEEGLILTCQAHPTTDKITIDYDAV
ncbi:MAG: ferredoxin--NADP reductase [Flavobacteriaceae bacterium]|nr:ferredoxin--NADP reductase [Flavobacteriaceae bacterium]